MIEAEKNKTKLVNKFLQDVIVHDPSMYVGNWQAKSLESSSDFTKGLPETLTGKFRFFISKTNNDEMFTNSLFD